MITDWEYGCSGATTPACGHGIQRAAAEQLDAKGLLGNTETAFNNSLFRFGFDPWLANGLTAAVGRWGSPRRHGSQKNLRACDPPHRRLAHQSDQYACLPVALVTRTEGAMPNRPSSGTTTCQGSNTNTTRATHAFASNTSSACLLKRGERFRYFGLLLLIPSNIAGSGRGRSQRKGWLNDRRLDAGQIGSSSASMRPTQRFGFRHSQTLIEFRIERPTRAARHRISVIPCLPDCPTFEEKGYWEVLRRRCSAPRVHPIV